MVKEWSGEGVKEWRSEVATSVAYSQKPVAKNQ